MKLHLNLATGPQENKRPFLAAAALVGTLGIVALVVLSHSALKSWEGNRDVRMDIARTESAMQADQEKQRELDSYFRSGPARQILDRSAFLNTLIDERSFPWTKIFMDLEETLPPGVRVVSIAPRLVNGRAEVTLVIGAATDAGKIQFLQAIEKSKVFSGMVVKDERRPELQASPDRIVLNLTVWYTTI